MLDLPHPLWTQDPRPALLASRNTETDEFDFPVLPPASPLQMRHETVPVAGVGHVYSYTVIHPGGKSGAAPYALGLVDFPGPVRIFGRLTGAARPQIGARYRAIPDLSFGYVFVAADDRCA
jgi:DUF35 OB-fold domain, acyl-CoA-associated